MSKSTIARELRCNSSTRGVYKRDKTQRLAEKCKHRAMDAFTNPVLFGFDFDDDDFPDEDE